MRMDGRRTFLCRCHPDFHIPGDAVVGKDFDGLSYARQIKAAGADSLVCFAKCHYGFSYYPTKVGTVHPGLQRDMLGEVARGCREHGLGITAYYSVFLDTAAVRKHPQWMLRPAHRPAEELWEGGKYLPVCVNSGYLDELLLPQAIEIVEQYEVDELFYDTMSQFMPCCCDNCRRLFGGDIPEDDGDPRWLDYVHWYYQQYRSFFARAARVLHERNPDLSVVFNWEWSARQPDMPVPHIRRLAGDLFTSGAIAGYYSRYWAGTGYRFDYMCGRFLHGLGDWSNNTPATLKNTGAAAVANGGGFYLIDRQRPDGSLEERAYAMMQDVFGFIQERRDVLAETEHLPETAVLYPLEHVVGPKMEYFPSAEAREKRMRQWKGAAKIFIMHGRHYTAINTDVLHRRLFEYKLLVLPEVEYLSADTIALIAEFVRRGGKLLLVQSGQGEAVEAGLLELAGAEYEGFTDLDYSYVEHETGGIPDPILVRGRFALVKPKNGARTVARLILPLSVGKGGREFGHGFAPAAGPDGHGAVIARRFGQGEVVYAAGPFFTSYETFFHPQLASLLLDLYDRLLPTPYVRIETPAQVEMAAVRKDGDLIIHLINHSGREILADGWLPITEHIPDIIGIKLSVKCRKPGCVVISAPDGEVMEGVWAEGYLCFTVPSLGIMRSFRVKDWVAARG